MSKLLTKNVIGRNQVVQTSTATTFNAGDVVFVAKTDVHNVYMKDKSNMTMVLAQLGTTKAAVETTLELDGLIFTSFDDCVKVDGVPCVFAFVTINENFIKSKGTSNGNTLLVVYNNAAQDTWFTLEFTGIQ